MGGSDCTVTRPPLKARPEPQSPAEIRDEIAFLEEKLNGQMDAAIQDRIDIMRQRLQKGGTH